MIKTIKTLYKLLRIKQWVKNILILLPLFFAGVFSVPEKLLTALLGFIAFSLAASVVYIVNDIHDKEQDVLHPRKRLRPIAHGDISVKAAGVLAAICGAASCCISLFLPLFASLVLISYFMLTIAYSYFLKEIPIVDVAVIASGFMLRVFYGSFLVGAVLSEYFLLTIFAVSLFMAFGKRRNELDHQQDTRKVLRYYNRAFLDKNMYMMATLALVFYSLWASNYPKSGFLIIMSVPVVIFILVRYSFVLEKSKTEGDPSELILSDIPLLCLLVLCIALLAVGVYA